jgi:chorismate--pyruvate lyase
MTTPQRPIFTGKSSDSDFLREWRDHEFSLTDKLQAIKGMIQLHVISQDWTKANWWDKYFLDIHAPLIFRREILMSYRGMEYWYARTVIPPSCYELEPAFFKRLETESLRNLVFNEPKVQRTHMSTYPIDSQCIEYSWVKKHLAHLHGTLWVRLSEFCFQEKQAFYLTEILFPELENI